MNVNDKIIDALDSPVFVVGPLRSGTTMLRLLLDQHPDINAFGEFEAAVSQAKGDSWPELNKYYEYVKTDRQTTNYRLKIDENLDYIQLVRSFLRQLYEKNPSPIIAASIHSRIDLIASIWPNARFIHLLRDPRDVANSCIGMGWVGNVYHGSKYWIEPELQWNKICEQTQPYQRYEIRYEALVNKPDEEMSKLCNFLNVTFNPEILELESGTSYSRPQGKFANQWKKRLSEKQIRWVESRCGQLMEKRGYQLASKNTQPVGSIEKIELNFQNRWYRIRFNVKRWGLKNYFFYFVSRNFGSATLHRKMQEKINQINVQHLK